MPKKFSKKPMTTFQKKVYKALRKIPRGKIITYKKLAELIGYPKAFRAVGNALNKNPDIKHIPCHRVIKSDGSIGGYRRGTKKKLSLLEEEGVIIQKGKAVL